ncbi:MAG: response regulator transcription factor [Hyphomicrobiales bacterium]
MNKIKYIILEDSYIIREGLKSILSEFPEAKLVFEGISNKKNYSEVSHDIDFVIVNPNQVPDNCLHYLNEWVNNEVEVGAIFSEEVSNQLKGKIKYFIQLNDERDTILDVFRKMTRGKQVGKDNSTILSSREKTILRHIAMGMTNNEIAEALFISSHTVMTHRKNITRKLEIKTVSGLTVYALLNNIISLNELK